MTSIRGVGWSVARQGLCGLPLPPVTPAVPLPAMRVAAVLWVAMQVLAGRVVAAESAARTRFAAAFEATELSPDWKLVEGDHIKEAPCSASR